MKYEYTDTTQLQVKFSMTPWEISKLLVWLSEMKVDDYKHKNMIKMLNNALEQSHHSMRIEADLIKTYIKTEENNA